MTLSDNRMPDKYVFDAGGFVYVETDVKNFIRKLKEDISVGRCWGHKIIETIDRLAGDKLSSQSESSTSEKSK